MLEKLKNNASKIALGAGTVGSSFVLTGVPVFAAETTSVADSITTSLIGVQTQALDVLGKVAPIGIGIAGAFLVWKYGMKFFKNISK